MQILSPEHPPFLIRGCSSQVSMSFQIVAGTGFFYVKIWFNHQSHSEPRLPFAAPWGLKELTSVVWNLWLPDCFFPIPQGGGGGTHTHTKHQSCYLGTRLSLFVPSFLFSFLHPFPLPTPFSPPILIYSHTTCSLSTGSAMSCPAWVGHSIHPSISPQPTHIQGDNIYFIIYLHHQSWGHKRAVANSPLSITHGPTTLWHDVQHTILTRDTQYTYSHTHTHTRKARHI